MTNLKTVEVAGDNYVVSVLTSAQVTRIAEAVVKMLIESNLDVVLADRIRDRMRLLDEEENQRELDREHARYAPGFDH
jgi:Trp operon repressor